MQRLNSLSDEPRYATPLMRDFTTSAEFVANSGGPIGVEDLLIALSLKSTLNKVTASVAVTPNKPNYAHCSLLSPFSYLTRRTIAKHEHNHRGKKAPGP